METPKTKRQRRESTPSHKVLSDMIEGHIDDAKSFKALCSSIVRYATENKEEDFDCLKELLNHGAKPNYNEHSILEITAGSPLFLAIKLNVPRVVELLLQSRASLTNKYDNKSPLQVINNLFILYLFHTLFLLFFSNFYL